MTVHRLDLVIDRLVVEGFDLAPDEAADLARAVERELRRLMAADAVPQERHVTFAEAKPLGLVEPTERETLARALAERIAAEAGVAP